MKYFMIFLLILGVHNTRSMNRAMNKNVEIKNKLMADYRKDVLPIRNNTMVNVSVGIALRSINEVNHIKGQLKLNIWLRTRWFDENLRHQDGNMKFYTDPSIAQSIWIPDIYLYNMGEKEELEYPLADVSENGGVRLSRPGLITITCKFNLENFPYDEQLCEIKMGSWSYNANEIYLKKYDPFFDVSNYQENEEWKLISYSSVINSKKYECCEEEYQDITFKIVIRRRSEYYNLNIIFPGFMTASLMIISLLIPHSTGERVSFATTIMLSVIVFLLILSDNLPKTSKNPLISYMFVGLLMISLLILFVVIIISGKYEGIKVCVKGNDDINVETSRDINNEEMVIGDEGRKLRVNRKKKIIKSERRYVMIFMFLYVIFMLVMIMSVPKYE